MKKNIIGNIKQDLSNKIFNLLNDEKEFPWFFIKKCSIRDGHENQISAFIHVFYRENEINSPYFSIILELLQEICIKENLTINKVDRITANLYQNVLHTDEMIKNEIHADGKNENFKTILYYVNDSDGDTLFYNDDKKIIDSISPQQGKYIIFNSKKLHSPGIPNKNNLRIVINIVFE